MPSFLQSFLQLFCLVVTVIASACALSAQTAYDGNQNLPPYGGFSGGQFDTVSLQNGNLHLHIPMGSWQERGGKSVWLALEYDTPVWHRQTTMQTINKHRYYFTIFNFYGMSWALSGNNGFWRVASPISSEYCPGLNTNLNLYNMFDVIDPEGVRHPAAVFNSGDNCFGSQTVGPTQDGSGMMVNIGSNPLLTLKDGTRIPLTQSSPYVFSESNAQQVDSNGNIIGQQDTLQRTLYTITQGPNTTLTSPLANQVKNTPAYTIYTVTDSFGNPQTYRVDYEAIDITTNFCGYLNNPPYWTCDDSLGSALVAPAKLTLPTGAIYQFSWIESTPAELGSISLPTGGTISYTYTSGCTHGPLVNGEDAADAPYDCRAQVASRTVTVNGTKSTWTYNGGTVTDPLGNQQVHVFSQLDINNTLSAGTVETKVSYYQGTSTSGKLLKQVATDYTGEPGQNNLLANIRPIRVTTTLEDGQVTKTETDYEMFSMNGGTWTRLNPTEVREYDYGSGAPGPLLRRTDYTYLHNSNSTYANLNIVDRPTSVIVYNGAGTVVSQTDYEYDNYTAGISPSSAVQHDSAYSTSYTTRGNVTAIERWRNTDNSWLTSRNQYDDAGNVLTQTDPLGHSTQYGYTDAWSASGGSCAPSSGQAKAFLTSVTNPLNETTTYSYYSCTGLKGSTVDPNNQKTGLATTQTYDSLERPILTTLPDTGWTKVCYTDDQSGSCYSDSFPIETITSRAMTQSASVPSTSMYDGLGRLDETQTLDQDSSTGYDTKAISYDALGRVATISNPYATTSDPTYGVTAYSYDALDRVLQVTDPDKSFTTNSYSGSCTTTTDESGKSRKTCTDGLSRLQQVFEDPSNLNYETDYSYDALGNLLTVTQKGGSTNSSQWRTRTFTYDSLSELLTSQNPEISEVSTGAPCTVSYVYDAAGNLSSVSGPEPNQPHCSSKVTATDTYDAANRILTESYSDGTPGVTYGYDTDPYLSGSGVNAIGRVAYYTNAVNFGYHFSYDVMGRQTSVWECLPGNPPPTNSPCPLLTHSYDLLGDTTSYANPQGVSFTQAFDEAARLASITSSWSDAQHPAALATLGANNGYWPNGGLRELSLGNGLTETSAYNVNMQTCRINVNSSATALAKCTDAIPGGNLQDFNSSFNPGGGDNGNLSAWVATGQQNFNRSYAYDSLDRISAMTDTASSSSCKGLSWTIDPWGNRTAQNVTSGSCPAPQTPVNNDNQFSASPYEYDAAGNMVYDGAHHYYYDAEDRLIQVDGTFTSWPNGCSTATACYEYDPNTGQRMEKIVGSSTTSYVRDLSGNVVGEWGSGCGSSCWTAVYVYGPNGLLAEYENSTTYFVHKDHINSTRLVTGVNESVCDSLDYLPFGEQLTGGSCTTHKFTGKERDAETASSTGANNGLDNFEARYYSSGLGRFASPDPDSAGSDPSVPQSLNLYSYVLNNPLIFTDPFGMDCVYLDNNGGTDPNGKGGASIDHNSNKEECQNNDGYWFDGTIASLHDVYADLNSNYAIARNTNGVDEVYCQGDTDTCGSEALQTFLDKPEQTFVNANAPSEQPMSDNQMVVLGGVERRTAPLNYAVTCIASVAYPLIPAPHPDDLAGLMIEGGGGSADQTASAMEGAAAKIKQAKRLGPSRLARIAKLEERARAASGAAKLLSGIGWALSAKEAGEKFKENCLPKNGKSGAD